MVPHVVRSQDLTPSNLRTIDTGPGTQSLNCAILLRNRAEPRSSDRPQAAGDQRQGLVRCPGTSAEAAAPAALAQMRAAANANGAAADANRAAADANPPPGSTCCSRAARST